MFLATALELEQQTLGLRELTLRDSLTGLRNRRYISERLPQLVSGAHYAQHPLALAIVDIDHFKLINDTYSHDGGDRVLASFASLLCEWYPDEGGIVRLGGEEFAIILPGASHADALRRCEQLRALVERHAWDLVAPGLRVTVSIGLASIRPGDTDQTMLHRADLCLYAAKMQGRNQVTDQPLVLV
jgi:diguanylate cyclase (GGDEF)-like protein